MSARGDTFPEYSGPFGLEAGRYICNRKAQVKTFRVTMQVKSNQCRPGQSTRNGLNRSISREQFRREGELDRRKAKCLPVGAGSERPKLSVQGTGGHRRNRREQEGRPERLRTL